MLTLSLKVALCWNTTSMIKQISDFSLVYMQARFL